MAAPQRNGPGVQPKPPEAAPTATLKHILISGTDLRWSLGENHTYFDGEGVKRTGKVVGMGVLTPPAEQIARDNGIFLQVTIIYDGEGENGGYKDVFIVADHLVIKNVHISAIAVVKPPQLVVPR